MKNYKNIKEIIMLQTTLLISGGNRQLSSYLLTRKCPMTAKNAVGYFSAKYNWF